MPGKWIKNLIINMMSASRPWWMAAGKPCSLCGLITNKSWISLSCLKIKIQRGGGGTIPDPTDCWLSCSKFFIADRIQWNINLRGPAGFMQPLSPRIKFGMAPSICEISHYETELWLSRWIRGREGTKVERQVYRWLVKNAIFSFEELFPSVRHSQVMFSWSPADWNKSRFVTNASVTIRIWIFKD